MPQYVQSIHRIEFAVAVHVPGSETSRRGGQSSTGAKDMKGVHGIDVSVAIDIALDA